MVAPARRVSAFGITIFSEVNTLAQQHQAINLGQGRPDFDGPPEVIAAAVRALQSGQHNQYPPGVGVPSLRRAVAAHAQRFYNLDVDGERGVLVTPGATEAVFAAIMALVDAGDEVIVIEPYFDSYVPSITMAGAVPVYVPLRPPSWTLDPLELRAAFNERTRAIILNTPHNPTGRVLTREELTMIAELCIEHDVVCISDEVYEHLIFDNQTHIPIATLPDMFERTVTISSAGKSFSVTGWKIGWLYGHPDLISAVNRAHQYIAFAANHPAQEAAAFALGQPNTYFEEFQAMYEAKRDMLSSGLTQAGFAFARPQGTYFIMADFSNLFAGGDDLAFVHHLIKTVGVAAIPTSMFYSPEHAAIGQHFVRFAFCKTDAMLSQAAERLAQLKRLG
jgi:N-succinyldiaminopimelate aminotransferase